MDVNCECDSGESCQSPIFGFMRDSSPSQPLISTACSLCQRLILSDNGTGDVDYITCSDCKFLLMEDLDSSDVRLRRTPAPRRTCHSSESTERLLMEDLDFRNLSGGESGTDIDPTDTGFYEWESEGQDDEIGDGSSLEEEDIDEMTLESSMTGGQHHMSSRSNGNNIFINSSRQLFPQPLRSPESLQVHSGGLSSILVDSVGDYLEARGFEYLVDHLAEAERLTKSAQPAAASFLSTMPCRKINEDNPNDMACAICKDLFIVGTTVNQLPCSHLYHRCCILPWLSTRNTCPLCRYELPTDDKDHEDGRRRGGSLYGSLDIHRLEANDDNSTYDRPSMSRNRWLLLAAPVAGLAGISLMFWLGGNRSVIRTSPIDNLPYRRNNNNRRWWPFF